MSEAALNAKSWPFEQARAILKRAQGKDCVVFETGYGPSGAPHIGTFAEVVRTNMVRRAFEELTDHTVKTRLIAFSDDFDGFRRVPANLPEDMRIAMEADIGKPLTSVRDPFGAYPSFAHRNNEALRQFLLAMGLEPDRDYEFVSATECYRAGKFDDTIRAVLRNYDAIRDTMLPTLGAERRDTYCPIMPISPVTGNVLAEGFIAVDVSEALVLFRCEDGQEHQISVLGGGAKLQWKVDWAMRWAALGVDYEMHGKDLLDSAVLSTRICKALGKEAPLTYFYELFLDDEGGKLSKSLGNGMTIEEWNRYSANGPLVHFMFQSPRSAKTFAPSIVPRVTDEYLKGLTGFPKLDGASRLDSSIWHIHGDEPPTFEADVSYNLMINLATVSGAKDAETLHNYLDQYKAMTAADHAFVASLVPGVINYVNEQRVRKPRRAPTGIEAAAFRALIWRLEKMAEIEDPLGPEDYQYWVYEIGKEFKFDPLRSWFQAIYEVYFGESQGPRFGSFIAAYGRERTIEMLRSAL